ncbi:MAG: hypothetical protein ACLRMZ_02375 [Blautia marasmi]
MGFIMPEILGSGHNIIDIITEGNVMLKTILLLFVMKLIFSRSPLAPGHRVAFSFRCWFWGL